jgi:hypothetical protein
MAMLTCGVIVLAVSAKVMIQPWSITTSRSSSSA